MHYVQDFVELIEGLPEEVVGKLKKIKELDQEVQTLLRNIRKKETIYFSEAADKTEEQRTFESNKILKDYDEVSKIGYTKVKLASELETLAGQYYRKLEGDLEKFKKELEAETPGITEKLERKKHIEPNISLIDDWVGRFSESNSPGGIDRREQSRFEPVSNIFDETFPYEHDKSLSGLELMDQDDSLLNAPQNMEEISIVPRPGQTIEWLPHKIDPNEPTYCTCNQVSYGEMVGCDNQKCPIEWFHYACVGIKEPPTGNWYCPLCRSMQKRQDSDLTTD
ncbi:Inhibitor of growth protein 4 [Oopsacas minuta]|uniref:Inhibitor of growth protein n=1 Tax=Oopsacas minuta TaxID=111878 RepID=A0AAV7K0P9_9METZ|nr:Inhibitor of growth protein 4 [Oopsacas minuta]